MIQRICPPLCLFLLFAFAQCAQAFYNPNTGRWISRDPVVELSFNEAFATRFPRAFLVPDKNEYGMVANNVLNAHDFLGAGIFCRCDPQIMKGATLASVDRNGKPTMDSGAWCASPNEGFTATRTITFMCFNRMFAYACLISCNKYTCAVNAEYQCQYTNEAKTGRLDYWWVSTGNWTMQKPCPK